MLASSPDWEKYWGNFKRSYGVLILLLIALFAMTMTAAGAAQAPSATPVAPAAGTADHPAQVTEPGPATEAASSANGSQVSASAPLRVMVDKSLLINTTERIKRISITDPTIADAIAITPTQILVHGRSPGEVSLLIWDELERSRSFDLRVDVDISACIEEEKRIFPTEQIEVTASRSAIVLSGHVTTEEVAKDAGLIAQAYSKNVVNVLTFGPVGADEVELEVKFAEVDRSAVTQLGLNVFTPGTGNTVGTLTTGQFGGFNVSTSTNSTTTAGGTTTTSTTATPPTINVSDPLNLFLFRNDINLGAVIRALQQKNLLQILAEPNLIAVNGKEASFLAGGEFPFPVVQPGQGFTAVTISFREFGVQLKFTPVIMPNGNIHLKVAPSVSALDFANALTISGFTVPALSTRKAETEFELQDGESFMIAGLMDNRVTNVMNKMPGIGDIPIIGNLFKSKNLQKSDSELMVLCTVHKISPAMQAPATPKYPQPFLNNEQFDGSKKPAPKKQ